MQAMGELPSHPCIAHVLVLAVRLQGLFGLSGAPRITSGRWAIKLHLGSPARRLVLLAQDLANFRRTTNVEVKKEHKGRYPGITGSTTRWQPKPPLALNPAAPNAV